MIVNEGTPAYVVQHATADTELEIRFGTIVNGRFVSAIEETKWCRMVDGLNSYTEWKRIDEPHQRHDFFIRDEVVLTGGNLRLSHEYREDTTSEADVRLIRKDRIARCDIHVPYSNDEQKQAIRIDLSREVTQQPPSGNSSFSAARLPSHAPPVQVLPPVHVRVKQTVRWATKSGWRFDASRVWSGKTLESCLFALNNGVEPRYELELELEDTSYLERHSVEYVIQSALLKVRDLCNCADYAPDNKSTPSSGNENGVSTH